MQSTSGKIGDRIAARQAAKNLMHPAQQAKPAAQAKPVKKKAKKLATSLKGAKATKLKKTSAKKKAVLDKKANPKALLVSKKKVSRALKKLGLVSAGFGRYHKAKGKPITHWVMRNPKNGLYVLADKELRAKLLNKVSKVGAKIAKKAVKADKKPQAGTPRARKIALKKAHEVRKTTLTQAHLARLDKRRAEMLRSKGKPVDKPLTKREQAKREASVRKLHRVLDKHFKKQQAANRTAKAVRKAVGAV